jgi:hypothetical protein
MTETRVQTQTTIVMLVGIVLAAAENVSLLLELTDPGLHLT